MRLPVALLALVTTLACAATAAAQQAPAPPEPGVAPAPPAATPATPAPGVAPPWAFAPYPYAPPPYAVPPYAGGYGWGPPPVTERRNEGARIAGIVFFAAGAVTTVVGAGILVSMLVHPCIVYASDGGPPSQAAAHGERIGTGRQALSSCDDGPTVGLGVLAGGVLGGLLGLPLFLVGNAQVRARPAALSVAPQVQVGARGADLRWTF